MTKNYEPIGNRDVFDVENSFYLKSEPYRIAKLLGQFEIYKNIVNLPGAIVECGVFKGISLVRWATFRYALETAESRKIIGFDAFGNFPDEGLTRQDDIDFANSHDDDSGGPGISKERLTALLKEKQFTNIELVKGNVINTVPSYFEKQNFERISILHLDMDVYEPTRYVLECIADRVVPGGHIVIDDYGTVSGATEAIDEFLAKRPGRNLTLCKGSYYKVPAYIVMD